MSESSDEEILTPIEVKMDVSNAELNLLPRKSEEKYRKTYENFDTWWHENGQKTYSEAVLLSYFYTLADVRQPNTLWVIFSMLKATMKTKLSIDIGVYHELVSFLKKNSEGHIAKTSKALTAENILEFLQEAPDSIFLATKVALIIGISGGCHSSQLLDITMNSFEKHSDKLVVVNLYNGKTKIDSSFVIREEYVDMIEKYKRLRPSNMKTDRFFLQYRNGKCCRQPIGRHKFGAMPKEIATYLKLENPEQYTGHCFRKTSAALLANPGALTLGTVKCHRGWNSSTVAKGSSTDFTIKKENISSQKNLILQTLLTSNERDCSSPFSHIEIKVEQDTESPEPTSQLISPQPSSSRERDCPQSPFSHIEIKVEQDNDTESQEPTLKIPSPKPPTSGEREELRERDYPTSAFSEVEEDNVIIAQIPTTKIASPQPSTSMEREGLRERCQPSAFSHIDVEVDNATESKVPTTKITSPTSSKLSKRNHSRSTTLSKIKVETAKITSSRVSTTKITLPKKNITFNLQNCTNFSFHFY